MICISKTKDGKTGFTGTAKDLAAVSEWVRCLMHLSYGPEKGEERYRKIRLVDALSLWGRSKVDE